MQLPTKGYVDGQVSKIRDTFSDTLFFQSQLGSSNSSLSNPSLYFVPFNGYQQNLHRNNAGIFHNTPLSFQGAVTTNTGLVMESSLKSLTLTVTVRNDNSSSDGYGNQDWDIQIIARYPILSGATVEYTTAKSDLLKQIELDTILPETSRVHTTTIDFTERDEWDSGGAFYGTQLAANYPDNYLLPEKTMICIFHSNSTHPGNAPGQTHYWEVQQTVAGEI